MTHTCPVCKQTEAEDFDSFRGTHPAFKNLRKSRCTTCGLIFADPMPNKSLLDAYNKSYFDTAHGGAATSIIARAFFTAIARLRLQHIVEFCLSKQVRVNSVLEVGPGNGYLAQVWLEANPELQYSAIETDETCHAVLSKIGVNLISPDSQKSARAQFDAVVLSHVLEHTDVPVEFLGSALDRLRPGGVIFIEVPCLDFLHKDIDEPHLLFFDKESLGILLSRLGLTNVKLSYHGRTIKSLMASGNLRSFWMKVRSKIIALGMPYLFSRQERGLTPIDSAVERAIIKPFKAHIETSEPAWWLRAIAVKR
jgi:SAM-dependent methyltransferase